MANFSKNYKIRQADEGFALKHPSVLNKLKLDQYPESLNLKRFLNTQLLAFASNPFSKVLYVF